MSHPITAHPDVDEKDYLVPAAAKAITEALQRLAESNDPTQDREVSCLEKTCFGDKVESDDIYEWKPLRGYGQDLRDDGTFTFTIKDGQIVVLEATLRCRRHRQTLRRYEHFTW